MATENTYRCWLSKLRQYRVALKNNTNPNPGWKERIEGKIKNLEAKIQAYESNK